MWQEEGRKPAPLQNRQGCGTRRSSTKSKTEIPRPNRKPEFKNRITIQIFISEGERAILAFKIGERNHVDGVPRAAFEERAVGALTGAQLAADAEQGIDDDAAKRGVVLVRRPIHAIRNGAVLDAGGRAGASRAAFIDHG